MQHAQCARTCPPHEAQSACARHHSTCASSVRLPAHSGSAGTHTTRQVSLVTPLSTPQLSVLRPARDSHHARSARAPHRTPPTHGHPMYTDHVHVLTPRLGVAWEKRPADSTLVRVRQGFTIRSRQVAPSSAPSGCSAAHRSMSGPRTDIDVWTQMTCTHTSPPPPHTHAPTNIASHRQAITQSAVASADQAGSRPGGSSYAPPPSSDGVLLCDGRLSAIDLAEPLVDP